MGEGYAQMPYTLLWAECDVCKGKAVEGGIHAGGLANLGARRRRRASGAPSELRRTAHAGASVAGTRATPPGLNRRRAVSPPPGLRPLVLAP